MEIAVDSLAQLKGDPLLRAFASVRDRDLRGGGDGLFIVEGEVVLRVLLAQRDFVPRAVLLSQTMADKLRAIVPAGLPLYVAPTELMQAIVGFPIHRGVLAVAERGAPREAATLLAQGGLVVGLCGLTNHDNVGGVFRNAAAFGAHAAILDGPTCDPLYRKALRVSVGGSLVVPYAQLSDEGAVLDALTAAGYEVLALSPRGGRVIGRDPPPRGPRRAVLLGAEGRGLSDETMRRASTLAIPMRAGWDSLNVAVASGIALAWLTS